MSFISNLNKKDSLLSRCFRGGAILGMASVVERGARFIRNMILTRLLAPEYFGLMALVLAASQLFEAMSEVGVKQAVVQNKRGADKSYLNVAWWFNAVRGVAFYITGCLVAPWLATIYHEPSLTPLLRVAFLALLLRSFSSPGLFVFEKQLKFGKVVLVTQGGGLFGTIISVILAIYYPSVWSLVIGFVMEAFFTSLGSFMVYPYWPTLQFNRQVAGELFRFSRGVAGLPILTYIFMQTDIFVLGRMCTKELLGYYSMAMSLAATPQMFFTCVFSPMILPVFSEMQEQKERLRDNLLRMTSLVYLFGLPTTTCLSIFSRPILNIVYGDNYGQVGTAFGLLNFYIFFYIVSVIIASLYLAMGRPELLRSFTLLRVILILSCIYPAIKWAGTNGAASARLLCMVLAGILQIVSLKKLLDLPVWRYLQTMSRGLILSIGVSLPALVWRYWMESSLLQVSGGIVLCGLVWLIAGLSVKKEYRLSN